MPFIGGSVAIRSYLDAPRRKFDAYCGLRLQAEFVAREAAEQVRLAYSRVSDQHNLE